MASRQVTSEQTDVDGRRTMNRNKRRRRNRNSQVNDEAAEKKSEDEMSSTLSSSSRSLQQLVSKFQALLADPKKQVSTVSIDEAASIVPMIMNETDVETSVTYDKSLYLWWDWYNKSKEILQKKKQIKNGFTPSTKDSVVTSHHDVDYYEDVLRHDVMEATSKIACRVTKLPEKQSFGVVKFKEQISSATLPHPEIVEKLQQLLPPTSSTQFEPKKARKKAHQLANELHRCVEHDDGKSGIFGFHWISPEDGNSYFEETSTTGKRGLAQLIYRLWECSSLNIRAVTLSLRVTLNTPLDTIAKTLDTYYQVSQTICPTGTTIATNDGSDGHNTDCVGSDSGQLRKDPAPWCIGPPSEQPSVRRNIVNIDKDSGSSTKKKDPDSSIRTLRLPHGHDERYYLIIGTPGGLTKSHWDRGIQTVLYHTVAGCNHVLAMPREVATMLQAVENGGGCADHNKLENDVLHRLSEIGETDIDRNQDNAEDDKLRSDEGRRGQLIQAGTFRAGETMLILPAGGHAVMTGSTGKVVLANEWHYQY